MATLAGSIIDKATGAQIEGKVRVLGSGGGFVHPPDSILKVGSGESFFYSDGKFEVDVTRGPTRVIVERGTEYVPAAIDVDAPGQGTVAIDVEMERWTALSERGWHPGNTHIHYDEKEKKPHERLQLDPRVEDLRMTAISILKRWDLEYTTNEFAPGMLTEFTSTEHYVQCGEENRHNAFGTHAIGYGHMMLLNIRNVVEPVSRGLLVDAFDPDYPPLCYAIDDAHRQGGIVIWCHNGRGMEAPIAGALGKLDAFNLFDPTWNDREYSTYYKMLNAGIRLPASTGSDWFICSANRVYAYTGSAFEYEDWLNALRQGRTFITNGPALTLEVEGHGPGGEIEAQPEAVLPTVVTWESHYPIHRVEVMLNGNAVATESFPEGSKGGRLETDVLAPADSWIAARLASSSRDSYAQPLFAHTSPVYVTTGVSGQEKADAAAWFDDSIEQSLEWVRTKGKFYTDRQRKEVVDLFREGQQVYKAMLS